MSMVLLSCLVAFAVAELDLAVIDQAALWLPR